jgi:hypothetical protein
MEDRMSGGGDRKVRSDKKRGVQPTISIELKDCIYRLSYITNTHVKDVAEQLCINGIGSNLVLSYISQNFRRDIRIDNTLYLGDINRASVKMRNQSGKTERLSIRFKSDTYEILSVLAYALDCSVARATGLLLDASVREVGFINEFVRSYLKKHLDENRMRELKKVFQYINANNPYEDEVSWFAFVSYLVSEAKTNINKAHEVVVDFVINKWSGKH